MFFDLTFHCAFLLFLLYLLFQIKAIQKISMHNEIIFINKEAFPNEWKPD